MSGLNLTVDPADTAGDVFEDRLGQLNYDFGNSGTILVSGVSA